MGLEQYTPEEIKELSMLEVAYEVFSQKKQAVVFRELLDEVVKVMELSEDQVKEKVAQFYTDINIDGRFICIGEAGWGLRSWYPYEQIDEEVTTPVKPKKKKGKKAADDEDLDLLEYEDELEEDELEFDDLDDYEEDDDLDDDDIDDTDDDEDLDEDLDDDDLDDDLDEDIIEADDDYDLDDDDEELEDDEELDEEDEEL